MEKIIVITGPTGIGKTEISLRLANYYNGEIINADASQFKKDLNIGTAKIDYKNQTIAHHLFDIIDAEDYFSITDYQELARKKINEIILRGKLPFLVGGSGLYINSAIANYELDSSGRDLNLEEKEYSHLTNKELFDQLKEIDPFATKNIHENNRKRVLRALVSAKEGSSISSKNKGNELIYDCLIIELTTSREKLYNRINQRFDLMLEAGWLDEIENLKTKNIDFSKIGEIGYKELATYNKETNNLLEISNLVMQKTRNYAKRQITWFKNKMNTVCVEIDYNDLDSVVFKIKTLIDEFLK